MTPKPTPAQAAYERVRDACLGFPGADVKLSHGAPSFHVRGKMFVVFVDDHHGDGRLAVWVKATKDEQRRLVAEDAERYFVPPYVGVQGWIGVRLDRDPDWIDLHVLVEAAWLAVVPKSLADKPAAPRRAPPMKLPTTDPARAEEALRKVSAICLALPEATLERSGSHATFRVRKKPFAYFLDNHHGDEIIAVCVKVDKREAARLAREHPKRFYLPQYIGPKGWLGMRVDRARTRWKDVAERVKASYAAAAPARVREARGRRG
jgi:hypothetical protein